MCPAQLKISYSVHQNLNVKANNDRSFDFTLPAGQQPGMAAPPQAAPQVRDPCMSVHCCIFLMQPLCMQYLHSQYGCTCSCEVGGQLQQAQCCACDNTSTLSLLPPDNTRKLSLLPRTKAYGRVKAAHPSASTHKHIACRVETLMCCVRRPEWRSAVWRVWRPARARNAYIPVRRAPVLHCRARQ